MPFTAIAVTDEDITLIEYTADTAAAALQLVFEHLHNADCETQNPDHVARVNDNPAPTAKQWADALNELAEEFGNSDSAMDWRLIAGAPVAPFDLA